MGVLLANNGADVTSWATAIDIVPANIDRFFGSGTLTAIATVRLFNAVSEADPAMKTQLKVVATEIIGGVLQAAKEAPANVGAYWCSVLLHDGLCYRCELPCRALTGTDCVLG